MNHLSKQTKGSSFHSGLHFFLPIWLSTPKFPLCPATYAAIEDATLGHLATGVDSPTLGTPNHQQKPPQKKGETEICCELEVKQFPEYVDKLFNISNYPFWSRES